jgi:hypothetical protein
LLGSGDVAVQATLVSGTNIKTLNSVSLLGSGDIVLAATPSGVAGAIQFSNGSAFASDATNFFWDDTNNRLGVGTNAPSATAHIVGVGSTSATTALLIQNSSNLPSLAITNDNVIKTANLVIVGGASETTGRLGFFNENVRIARTSGSGLEFRTGSATLAMTIDNTQNVGIGIDTPTARTHIKGSGSTSATTSLLVQNSAGATALTIRDDGSSVFSSNDTSTPLSSNAANSATIAFELLSINARRFRILGTSSLTTLEASNTGGITTNAALNVGGSAAAQASAILQADSTTKGFLPPRMTTTQRNAIASPAAGLMIYNTTTAKLNVYTTAWEAITSL